MIGGKSREVLEWAAEQENPIAQMDIDNQFGAGADLLDQWDEVDEMNQQVYTILRATTEGAVFDLVENAPKGAGKLGGPCTGSSTLAPEDASA